MPKMALLKPKVAGLTTAFLLGVMLLLLLSSVREDAFIVDEPVHITAGYAALRFRTARLNPEHPPLLKLLAAVPLLWLPLHFPTTHPAMLEVVGESSRDLLFQWELAGVFLYGSGNNPHQIAAWARLAPIGLTLVLAGLLFGWVQRWAGVVAALLTLVWYTFSPAILAHGRLVTTDIAAALGVVLVGLTFSRFLTHPSSMGALRAGLALGIALLLKFSTALLLPFCSALLLLWMVLEPKRRLRYLTGAVLMGSSAALLVLLPYLWMTARYPPTWQLWESYLALFEYADGPLGRAGQASAKEDVARLMTDRTRDLRACLGLLAARRFSHLPRCPAELVIFLADKPVVRAGGNYLLGALLTAWHTRMGHLNYFRGEVSTSGWRSYFPVVYAIKEPLTFHLLSTFALLLTLTRVWSSTWSFRSLASWLRQHPTETFMLGWLALYWSMALSSRLNIGIRHLLPVFPFTMMLVSRQIGQWVALAPRSSNGRISCAFRGLVVASLVLWQVVSVLRMYPSFLAYFNEAVGGPAGGVHYVVDSNLDWGQDLRRLRAFVEAHQIEPIAVAYFGGGSPAYELGDKYIPWSSAQGPYLGWLAISVTLLAVAQAHWDPALDHRAVPALVAAQLKGAYPWLRDKIPVAQIGYSIAVFDLRSIK